MEDRGDYGAAHIALRGDFKSPGEEVQPVLRLVWCCDRKGLAIPSPP